MDLHKGSIYQDKAGNCFEYLGTDVYYSEFTLKFRNEFGRLTYRFPSEVKEWFDE